MIVDCIAFNGEYDLFDLRYNILKDYVDEFRVVEFDKTFSGKDKPCYVKESKNYFYDPINTWPKVKFYPMEEKQYEKYYEAAGKSPNTGYGKGAKHWITEWAQKESIKDCLTDLKDDDIVFIGDCDEIWDPEFALRVVNRPLKLGLLVYAYYLNQRSSETFTGTLRARYKDIKNACLNHLRTIGDAYGNVGWHFTNMGGVDQVRRKLNDSYTQESYNTSEVQEKLEERFGNTDYIGRNFTFKVDESKWPQYLKDNREKYKHLLK